MDMQSQRIATPRPQHCCRVCAGSTAVTLVATVLLGAALVLKASGAEPSAKSAALITAMTDASRPEPERLKAIRRLGEIDFATAGQPLLNLTAGTGSDRIRLAAVQALETLGEPEAVAPLLRPWTNYPPAMKIQVLHTLTARKELAQAFVGLLEQQQFPAGEVDSATRQRLANFPDDALAARSKKLFARQPWLDARATLERFRPALALAGNAARGQALFRERICVNCHRVGEEGHFVGADLFSAKTMSREELLQQIVAPNLFFMPTFQAFMAEAGDGELVEGVLAASTDTTVTIRQAGGVDRTFNRTSLRRLKGLNVSLMPEGLLEGLSHQQVADLLEFLKGLRGL